MQSRRRQVAVLGVILAAAVGTACGEEESEPAAQAPKATATATAAAETPTAAAEKTGSGEVTPLGSKLKVGEPAVIDYKDATTQGESLVEVTPKRIEKGSLDDFKNMDLDEKQKASTPFYATIAVKNVGDGDLSGGSPATYINGVDDRGQDHNELIFIGDFERCDNETPKKLKPGDAYEACLTYLIPGGGELKGFHWIAFDEKTGKSDLFWE